MLDMMIQLMGFVAQNERYKIRERQMQGIKLLKQINMFKSNNYSIGAISRKVGISRQQIYRVKKREELAKTQEETKNEIYKA